MGNRLTSTFFDSTLSLGFDCWMYEENDFIPTYMFDKLIVFIVFSQFEDKMSSIGC